MSLDLRFNVIFVPGTVKYLRLATESLLRYSPYRYRLVANGLKKAELNLLQSFSSHSERLSFLAYPTKQPLEHGMLLSLLAARHPGDYFCFLDSDVFATEPFSKELEELLETYDVVSSCSHPLWDPTTPSYGFQGRSSHAPTGERLASSFFAVYRADLVKDIMLSSEVGFERYFSETYVPGRARKVARRFGWRGERCDTSKMLCLMALGRGARVTHLELPGLMHIGAIGWWFSRGRHEAAGEDSETFTLRDRDLAPASAEAGVGESADRARFQRRIAAAQFFGRYLEWLFGEGPEPRLEISDPEDRAALRSICRGAKTLYEQSDLKRLEGRS